ncbi:MAG TPA: STAS domain-containing protein [Solirubrobacteraceae bacterium]|jgi:anti-sigma B factor antagonist|nr:STAS domain-containing protein [Solirubrobacteraceae bacterium]
MDAARAFEVVDLPSDKVAGVAVRGEVELATAPALTAALEEGIRRSSGAFVIDLVAVDFLDSSGVACLVRARALLGRDDRALALICPPGSVRRVLELTGIDELVPVYGSRDELTRALTRRKASA